MLKSKIKFLFCSVLFCIFCAITTIGVIIRLSAFIIVLMNKLPLLKLMKPVIYLFVCISIKYNVKDTFLTI